MILYSVRALSNAVVRVRRACGASTERAMADLSLAKRQKAGTRQAT